MAFDLATTASRLPAQGDLRYRHLVDSISDQGLLMLDLHGRIVTWNSGAERLFGFAEDEALGRPLAFLYAPQEASDGQPHRLLEEAATHGQAIDVGWRLHKDGRQFGVRTAAAPIFSAHGGLQGYSVTLREVPLSSTPLLPDEARAPGAPANPETPFRAIVEGITDYAIFLVDHAGRVQSWNPGAERMFGHAAADVIGQPFARLYLREDCERGEPHRALSKAAEAGRLATEGWRLRACDSVFWARCVLTAVRDAEGPADSYIAVLQDLTEARRAEEGMRRGEQRARMLLDGVRDQAIIMLDREGMVESWNDATLRMFGYESFELAGQSCTCLYVPDEDAGGLAEDALRTAALDGRCEQEGWRRRRDGTRFWASDTLTPLRDERGAVHGYVRVLRDLSDRQCEIRALRQANSRLEMMASERANALQREVQRRQSLEGQLQLELQRMRNIVATLKRI